MTGHPLFGPIPEAHVRPLLSACAILLTLLTKHAPAYGLQAMEDLQHFTDSDHESDTTSREELDTVLKTLRGSVLNAPLAAMIAARVAEPKLRRQGHLLSAWVLAATLRRMRTHPGHSAIGEGLHAMRRLKTRAPRVLAHLSILPPDINGVMATLQFVQETKELSKRDQVYLARIAALLRYARDERAAIHRERESRLRRRSCATGPDTVEEIPEALDEQLAGPSGLQADDQPPAAFGIVADGAVRGFTPSRVARNRAAQAARSAGRRELALTAEHDPLTALEVAVLVHAARQEPSSLALNKILMLLAFGTATPETGRTSAGRWAWRDKRAGVILLADLPDFAPLLEGNMERVEDLFLPVPWVPDISLATRAVKDTTLREAFKATLKVLAPALARPLTLGRIMRFKGDWLRRAGADPAVIGFLLGTSPGERAQMHYTSLDRQILQDWHNRYIRALGLVAGLEAADAGRYGARMQIPEALLRLVCEEQQRRLRNRHLPSVASFAQLRQAHDAYAIHTLMLLYFATGHRPVTLPFEYLADMDLGHGLMWIADKVGRGGRGSRMIVLPDQALRQLRYWCDHLRRLADRLRPVRPDVVEARILPALAERPGAGTPLFFLLDDDGCPREIDVTAQKQALSDILPAPLNWARHVLRSTLVARGAPPDAIDAFFGHAHLGTESFAPASALRIDDLRGIAREVERILEAHGIEPMESPL
ncbi:hypothetical protein D2T29_13825 [Sinirhodobacter populi]|uniref:Uncharacterized protein n=1 Tax=Paenirhodobacter populi TaxID=2306993 RepID=A0A443KAM3_9RHOB|nr:hypothetical protein [Sinirhodobacter populi]RWR29857.1 hypothetical protein D2T29_13825 [Sinirhodobacter populi]